MSERSERDLDGGAGDSGEGRPHAPEHAPVGCGTGASTLPRHILLANLEMDATEGTVAPLLADFEDALLAYDRLTAGADEGHVPPSFVHARPAGEGKPGSPGSDQLAACDTVIVGYRVETERDMADRAAAMRESIRGHRVQPEARLYAIAVTKSHGAQHAASTFMELGHLGQDSGLTWCGGLVIPDGALIPHIMAGPRMGALRRPTSEATDRLIGAVRAGITVARAAERFGARGRTAELAEHNIIEARCALPRWLYGLIERRMSR